MAEGLWTSEHHTHMLQQRLLKTVAYTCYGFSSMELKRHDNAHAQIKFFLKQWCARMNLSVMTAQIPELNLTDNLCNEQECSLHPRPSHSNSQML